MRRTAACFVLFAALPAQALKQRSTVRVEANPIRKVVNLLQSMQKKVTEEGEKEEKLYEDFMCYCKTGGADLSKSIDDAETKIGELGPDIKSSLAKLDSLKEGLAQDKADRSTAEKTMAEATALREKEAATYAKYKSETTTNIAAVNKASAAISNGMEGAFLQTTSAAGLKQAMSVCHGLEEEDRQVLTSFLQGSYAPASGQIVGILKTMKDEMEADFEATTKTETTAIEDYEELMTVRKKEKATLTKAIQEKLERISETEVSTAEKKNDLVDTTESLAADKKFLANLDEGCATKTKEWEARSKTRTEELAALADTIKILNNDDALELFKKTLPSASASFMQLQVSSGAQRSAALAAVQAGLAGLSAQQRVPLDLISLALRGKKIGFEKIIAMIKEMVATLKQDQKDDDAKKEYCGTALDKADDKKKGLERDIRDLDAAIATLKENIETFTADIASLKAGIKALDSSVAEATENRKKEHAEYKDLIASDSAAKEVLRFAKNRLNKFYNPKLAKALLQSATAPPPPPETFGAYSKKDGENGGVIQMIDLLIADLDKEMTTAETEEKLAQEEYDTMMKDSAEKRTADSKALTQQESAVADAKDALESRTDEKKGATRDLGETLKNIGALHTECDWLLKYYKVRADARAGEIDALEKASAVLAGADYSL